MQENPYQAPVSSVQDPVSSSIEIPDEITKKIKSAYIAGIISGSMTLLFVLISIFLGSVMGMNIWGLFDVALIFGLAFGIYKKSRTAALILLIYFVSAKILLIVRSPETGLSGIVLGAVFAYYYYQGVVGTFQYHSYKASHDSAGAV